MLASPKDSFWPYSTLQITSTFVIPADKSSNKALPPCHKWPQKNSKTKLKWPKEYQPRWDVLKTPSAVLIILSK